MAEKMFTPERLDLTKTKTDDVWDRHNLVRIDTLVDPYATPDKFESEELEILAEKITKAKQAGAPIIMFFGAHVVKCGMSRILIEMMKKGFVTHLASNGAGSIHDFELAYLGGTSEDVPTAIEDGSFGMWKQTGAWMNQAINAGYSQNMGYGQSLAQYISDHPERFPNSEYCVVYNAYKMGVPATYHITIGTDIIHQHPEANFASIGGASGLDFAAFCHSVAQLENGVHMNVGSSVTGPEEFLKALSIGRNQGHVIQHITTANFDILPLGDYRSNISKDRYDYYYRPRKNVINRPVSLGGTGLYIYGHHEQTLPNLFYMLTH